MKFNKGNKHYPDDRALTDSRVVRNSRVPTAVEASRGVKTKYDLGDTTTVWNFFWSSCRDKTNPDQLRDDVRTENLQGWGY